MAVNAATLDAAKYTYVYATITDHIGPGRPMILKQLPFAYIDVDGEQWITTLPTGGPLTITGGGHRVVGQTFMPDMPFPNNNHGPAPDSSTVPGNIDVHYFHRSAWDALW